MKSKIQDYQKKYLMMSKTQITFFIAFLISISSFAQQGINYKALIKDNQGSIVANQDVTIRFTMLDALSDGNIEFQESHDNIVSDANGIVIANIGEGIQSLSYTLFNDIDWGSHMYYLRVEIDITGGTNFTDMGTTQFMAVPYALHAKTIKNQAFKSENGLTIPENINDDFVFGNTQLDNVDNNSNSRMFFNTGKSSFRAGRTLDDEWDDTNVGNRSVAFGLNTIASGSYSTALGNRTKAESYASTAIGTYNVGGGNTNSWIDTDPLFEIGNGTATVNTETRTNALTVLKNGTTIVNNKSDNEPDLILGGTSNSSENGIISSDPQYPSSDIFIESNDKVFVYLDADNNESNSAFTIVNSNDTSVFKVSEDGNTVIDGELNTTSTGSANMIPIAYGTIASNGDISTGSGNFTVTNYLTGAYYITINNEVWNTTDYITMLSRIGNTSGFIKANLTNTGLFQVTTSNYASVAQNTTFSFVIYKP
ncbi:hypothetical protein [Psychroserpens ponticola]|uniref:Trimeric autotransporter adhesin YadA-like head domain-containing protein n=1 Tax=Psychroserpens ponticola TaxID=2932268 RepID=A0ABY7RXY8_9FLAO|nr:hypothetical protein [Psychroserpens ponticola]WCO01738.1 hypothetical protein MUN68_016965 [Psychroserpens ponticola]